MARYQVVLAYDGSLFRGFQRQGTGSPDRTVQGVVEDALRTLGWQGTAILAAGRTDTGVHASGQVIAFDLEWRHPTQALLQALNARLPADVAAQSVQPTWDDFHPRYDALHRLYHYRIFFAEVRHPLHERFAWRLWPPLDLDRLQQAAAMLVGRHDFAAFGAPPRSEGSTVRDVALARWIQEGSQAWRFEIQANAFLYHMVRCTVFAQVAVAQGLQTLETLQRQVQDARPRSQGLAPPHGLSLVEVEYPHRLEDRRQRRPAL